MSMIDVTMIDMNGCEYQKTLEGFGSFSTWIYGESNQHFDDHDLSKKCVTKIPTEVSKMQLELFCFSKTSVVVKRKKSIIHASKSTNKSKKIKNPTKTNNQTNKSEKKIPNQHIKSKLSNITNCKSTYQRGCVTVHSLQWHKQTGHPTPPRTDRISVRLFMENRIRSTFLFFTNN